MIRFLCLGVALAFGSVLVSAKATAKEDASGDGEQLTVQERALVRQLAEQALKEHGLLKGKVYLTGIEVLRDSTDKESERNALVTHYRYDGDLTLVTSINIGRKKVTDVETLPHSPASLAPEELAEAEKLARANVEVRRALGARAATAEVDALVHYTIDPKSPYHNHRVVRLFFRQGRTYILYAPIAEVDLTTGTVRAERIDKAHN